MNFKYIIKKIKLNKLITDSLWSLAGNVVGRGLALLAGILIARFLGKDIYGEYGIIKTTILTVGVFSTFGLGYTATKYIAEFKINNIGVIPHFLKIANLITLSFSGGMAALIFIFSEFIAINWLEAEHLSISLRFLSILIVFNAITTTQIGVLSGFGKFKEIAKINSFVGFLTFIFSVILTYFFDLNGALLALLIVQILNCTLNYVVVKIEINKIPDKLEKFPKILKSVLVFTMPIALQEGTYSVASWLYAFIIIRFSNYGELGLYSAAMQWNAIVLFIPGILRNVVLSHLSNNNNNIIAHNKILKQTVGINILSTIIPCFLIFLLSPIISKIYGESFLGLSSLISVAVFITVFSSVTNVYTQAYISLGRNWLMFYLKGSRDALILIVCLVFINFFDFSGAKSIIYSSLLCSVLYMFVVILVYRFLNKNAILK